MELFRLLYHSASVFLQWAYPPRVIVHTGDSNIEGPYRAIFSEYSLWTEWVSFASTVQVPPTAPSRASLEGEGGRSGQFQSGCRAGTGDVRAVGGGAVTGGWKCGWGWCWGMGMPLG